MTGSPSSVTRQIAPSVPAPGVQRSLWRAKEAVATDRNWARLPRSCNVRGFLVYLIFVLNTGSFCNHGVLALHRRHVWAVGSPWAPCRLGGSWPD